MLKLALTKNPSKRPGAGQLAKVRDAVASTDPRLLLDAY
jgi:hypothetical protein